MYIKAKNIKKQYGEGTGVIQALKGVDIELQKGEIAAVLGESGCGKTSLINIIAGIGNADEGEVIVGDYLLNRLTKKEMQQYRRNKVGMIYPAPQLLEDLTVGQNIDIGKMLGESDINYDVMMKVLGLTDMESLYPAEISTCQRQCCMVARALMKGADILLCDEPEATMDTRNTATFYFALEELKRKFGITVIIATHNETVTESADRVYRMKDGLMVSCDKNDENMI